VLAIVPDGSMRYWRRLHQGNFELPGAKSFAVHYRGRGFRCFRISRPSASELVSSEDEGSDSPVTPKVTKATRDRARLNAAADGRLRPQVLPRFRSALWARSALRRTLHPAI